MKDFNIKQALTVQIVETIPGTGIGNIKEYIDKINRIDQDMPMLLEHLNSWEEYDQAIAYVNLL